MGGWWKAEAKEARGTRGGSDVTVWRSTPSMRMKDTAFKDSFKAQVLQETKSRWNEGSLEI